MNEKKYYMPNPIIDLKEKESIEKLTIRYEKITKESNVVKIGRKVGEKVPDKAKEFVEGIKKDITEAEFYERCMEYVAKGFDIVEKEASKVTINPNSIIIKVNDITEENDITTLDEICFARSYNISKLVSNYRTQDLALALVEGGTCGAFGFFGLVPNLVFSIFLFYRAVQSVAMFYGYDVKNDPSELVIAGEVFVNSLSPRNAGTNEMKSIIGKILIMTELTAVKQGVKKTWTEMAANGGARLLIVQMRALANQSAKKALEKAGKKGLEESVFKDVFEQIGKKLTKKAVGKGVPGFGAIVGSLFDVAQMNKTIEYADIFYNKRFIFEKEHRVNILINGHEDVIEE